MSLHQCFQIVTYTHNESAKLHALHAKNMLTCQHALCAYVLTCSCAHLLCVLKCPRAKRALHAYVSMYLACLHAHLPMCLACLCAHLPTCLVCSHAQRANFDVTIFSFAAIVSEVARIVDKV